GDGAMQAGKGNGAPAAGQADPLDDLAHCANLRVLLALLRDKQHAVLLADLDGERDVHVRENDGVFQRNEQEGAQSQTPSCVLTTGIVAARGPSTSLPKISPFPI